MIRPADATDRLIDPGTRVRVWPRFEAENEPTDAYSVLSETTDIEEFTELCRQLCPTLDVNLEVEVDGSTLPVVAASDWKTCSDATLLERTGASTTSRTLAQVTNPRGELVGRAALVRFGRGGVITVGGFRATRFPRTVGVFIGGEPNLARDRATAVLDRETFERWLKERLVAQAHELGPEWSLLALSYGWEVGDLRVCQGNGVGLTTTDVTNVAREHDTIVLTLDSTIRGYLEQEGLDPDSDYYVHDAVYLLPEDPVSFADQGFPASHTPDVMPALTAAIGEGWGVSAEQVSPSREAIEVGETHQTAAVIIAEAFVFNRPA